ncbi:MAG TPA: SDR family NAD(P)-dependent oxidoreductase, partial [Deinococcales bacterium]|nr:SDR family NAD(P)-dependent oxidoreductase [Deinococcales bacterium]
MKLKPLGEQVAVVFGASSGIGRETALRLAARGARVVVAARDDEGLQSLVSEIESAGGQALAVTADARHWDDVKAVADRAAEHFGRLDTWVHAAAVAVYATFEETAPKEFKRVVETNLVGQAYGAMAALPHLRAAGGGALIHISSVEA